MMNLKARVHGGHLVLSEPLDFPEGTEVELVIVDAGDEMDEQDRADLDAALARSEEQLRAGLGVDPFEALPWLRES